MMYRNSLTPLILGLTLILGIQHTYAQECGIIYVAPNGASAGTTGTRANPASLAHGLSLANATENVLWLATGTYSLNNELSIPNGVTLEGGFDPATWVKSNASATVLQRTAANPLPSPANALVGLAGLNANGFRLQDLTINVADAPGPEISVYGIYLAACSNYSIVRCEVTTGQAGPGLPGTDGAAGADGSPGSPGLPAANEANIPAGGSGGTGAFNGGNGGTGAKHNPQASAIGQTGGGNCGGTGGNYGDGPACGCGIFGTSYNSSCSGSAPTPGQPGGNGTAGSAGAPGPQGTYANGYFVPGGPGGNGTTGTGGCGGGGGGGGAGRQQDGSDDVGGSGGGGGGGGFGGEGGTGGTGGGGSFAIFLWNNGANGNITDCALNAGPGGPGGTGGNGGPGGTGGAGGAGGPGYGCAISNGAAGGNGGNGGNGGPGGNGATGPSLALSEQGNGNPVNATNNNGVPGNPPIISVENYGCTNAEMTFSASGGNGSWDFGTGATPQTASGNGPIAVTYSSTGRRTITYAGTAFTDFIGIFNNGPALPSITPANPTVDAGCPNQFTTALVGTQYDWVFGPVASPATESGAVLTTTSDVYFSTPGTYWVKVTVLTDCCGPVTDSTQVTVQANAYDVTLTASSTVICEGDPITFTATPSTYDNYEFFIDGTSVQNGPSNTYTSSSIQQGDSIWVEAFVGSCFANPSDTIVPTVNPIPTVTLASDDADNEICEGETITFTASPPGMDNYEFFNGTNSLQSGSSEILFGTVPMNNSITVVATQNGCPSVPSNAIVTQVNPIPVVSLTSSDPDNSICVGDDVTFTALPPGLANYEFFEGVASVQNGNSNLYQTNSLADGTDVTVIATSVDGCVSAPSQPIAITVNPYPVVTLSSSDPDNEICEGESITFTASPAGLDTYEFFNSGTSVQNSPSETLTTIALTNGNSISVQGTQNGCTSGPSTAISITIIAAPTVDPGSDLERCADAGDVILSGFSPPGGTWTGTGIIDPTGVFSPGTAGVGSFVLSYTASNSNCSATGSITATVHALPTVVAGNYGPLCEGESMTLGASGADSYLWDPPTALSDASIADPVFSAMSDGTYSYTVTGTDANGCSGTDQTTIVVEPVPQPGFSAPAVCIGDTMTIANQSSPSTGVSYQWSFGNGQSSTLADPQVLYQAEGTYTVTLNMTWGNCAAQYAAPVTVHPRPAASFLASPDYTPAIEPFIQFTDLSVDAVAWQWDFGDLSALSDEQNPSHTYSDTGMMTITLMVFNTFGCTDTILDSVYIAPYTTLYVPSAFTPDRDRINDTFKAFGKDIFWFDLRVFDRWGKELFVTNDLNQGWNGTDMKTGREVKAGLYAYQILYEDFRGRRYKKLGRVSLIR